MSRRLAVAAATAGSALLTGLAAAWDRGEDGEPLTTAPAADAIARAANRYPVVLVGEVHQWSELHRFLRQLIASRALDRFDDVAVEFGNARYQSLMDRYVAGGDVDQSRLRAAWEGTTQGTVWATPDYAAFFAAVRKRNLSMGPERRVRVLLGDPPIDVDRGNAEERDFWVLQRDIHFAHVLHREVLSRGRHVLVVAGVGHVIRRPAGLPTLTNLLEGRASCETDPRSSAAGIDWCDDLQGAPPTSAFVVVPQVAATAAGSEAKRPLIVDVQRDAIGALPLGRALGGELRGGALRDAADALLVLSGTG